MTFFATLRLIDRRRSAEDEDGSLPDEDGAVPLRDWLDEPEPTRNERMARKHRFESPALQYLFDRYVGDDPKQVATYEEELANAQVARAIYDLRTQAKLTQAALAKRMGTTASVVSRLEDAEYEGHSVAMLRRVAEALDRRLEIRFLRRRKAAVTQRKASTTARKKTTPRNSESTS